MALTTDYRVQKDHIPTPLSKFRAINSRVSFLRFFLLQVPNTSPISLTTAKMVLLSIIPPDWVAYRAYRHKMG